MSGLYRTFKENYVPYFADGRGRDRYIAYNNAGFLHDFPKNLSSSASYKTGTFFGTKIIQHYKSPSVKAPNFHYYSDGNGRDKYILVNGGGLFYDSKPLVSFKLTDFLRKNENQYQSHSPTKRKRVALSRDELKYLKLLRNKEKELIKRLYTNEKKKFMKKRIYDHKNWFSYDEMKNDDVINKKKSNTFYLPKCNNSLKGNEINGFYTTRYKLKNNNNNESNSNYNRFNNEDNDSQLNILKNKPKIIIDAYNDNKINIISKNKSQNLYKDIEKIKKYQTTQNKNKNLFKKQPYFHILNDNSIQMKNNN